MPGRTETTLIAAFRSSSDAQAAAHDLEAAGISENNIYLTAEGSQGTSHSQKSTSKEGGITGWFKSVFTDEGDSDRSGYENAIQRGNCLLRVDVDEDEISTVEAILDRHSPVDVHASATDGTVGSTPAPTETTDAIPVVKEELQVGKRQVLRGGVRVYSRIVEEPVEESIGLREEKVRVERKPVNRAATEADLSTGQEEVIEVQEFAEEPVIAKRARVVEEVRVGKDVSERTETVRDTIRHTEVDVEQTPGTDGSSYDDSDFRSDYEKRYATSGATYDAYQPAYRYGYEMASDSRYNGRSYDEIEPDLQSEYGRQYPQGAWEKVKDAVRYGWNKVTGKAQAAAR